MRKLIIGAVTAVALLVAPVAAGAATADPPGWTPVADPLQSGSPNGSLDLPAGPICAFAVDMAVVTNNELQKVTMLPDGSTVTMVKGKLVLSFQNVGTGKIIDKNVSGSTTTTINAADTSGSEQGTGNNWFIFGPNGQKNTGEPGVVVGSGRFAATFTIATDGVKTAQTFSLDGHQDNMCALLS
jgi:hypothetical protein